MISLEEFITKIETCVKAFGLKIKLKMDSNVVESQYLITVDIEKIEEAIGAIAKNMLDVKQKEVTITTSISSADSILNYNLSLDKKYFELSISDKGRGIKPFLKDKIFDAFYTTKQDGTGLGLAIAKGIIDAHDGKIVEEGAFGKGALFKLIFPVK